MNTVLSTEKAYLDDALYQFRELKKLGDGALAQVGEEDFFAQLDGETNSIALNLKHMAGNMFSRWRDFLTADGEKLDRRRDTEFVLEPGDTRATLLARWESGWQYVFDAVTALTPEDLVRTVRIRSQPLTVVHAINRQLTHYAYHVGQIVLLAKHFAGSRWKTLSIPRGRSAEFDTKMERTPPQLNRDRP